MKGGPGTCNTHANNIDNKNVRKLVLIVATSLDGFVAGENGELTSFDASEENLQFVCDISEEGDTALFGRLTFQLLDSYWPTAENLPNASKGTTRFARWYNNASKLVVSTTLHLPSANNTTVISEDVLEGITKLKEQAGKNILLFGSPMVYQSIAEAGLIDDYWIYINPVIFGKGIPLFAGTKEEIKLTLLETKQFPNGEIALNYVVNK